MSATPAPTVQPFDRASHCRAIAASGGRATVAKHGRPHMATIGRAGFLAFALKLSGHSFYATADAVAALGEQGAFRPFRDS